MTANETRTLLDTLSNFQHEAKLEDFVTIFGNVIAEYLWGEFCNHYGRRILALYGQLDDPHRQRLAVWLEGQVI